MTTDDKRREAQLWEWEHDGPKSRARLTIVSGGETVKEYPWSKWVKFPTPIKYGYWK